MFWSRKLPIDAEFWECVAAECYPLTAGDAQAVVTAYLETLRSAGRRPAFKALKVALAALEDK